MTQKIVCTEISQEVSLGPDYDNATVLTLKTDKGLYIDILFDADGQQIDANTPFAKKLEEQFGVKFSNPLFVKP